ncbi:class II glutamine amidotransferase [Frankia sp. R82]|uniref:class II glutamine amidotransferase n=1 Tax=Frankia sp. R82 TaxID=2950553 RepID=UPI002044B891|nr:class II glutamine amidotransferase [Frankia sp. R82]MCM3883237.1 class II glutamine amidotransferase [Frankia sp. R82]
MCRLFGLTSAPHVTRATFWLLDAPDSLDEQSRRNPDGTGLGFFAADGRPELFRQPIAAWQDQQFAAHARHARSTSFVAHVRHASTGAVSVPNTHPFERSGRLFAHNGVVEGLPALEHQLGAEVMASVGGETDSERLFALIDREIDAAGGNVARGITTAARWVAAELPLYSINLLLASATELWALRYPDTNSLHVLRRPPGGQHGGRALHHADATGATRVHASDLIEVPAVVVASEPMDEHPDWRALASGELLHVGPHGEVTSRIVLPDPPAHPLQLADLRPEAATSQHVA